MNAFATALKKIGKLVYEIVVAWINFGKGTSQAVDMKNETEKDTNDELPTHLDFTLGEFNFPNNEPFYGLCPKCGEKKMLTRWVKLTKEGNTKLYCQQCASSINISESVIPVPA